MIPARDQWGPFVPDIDPAEQRARLRSLRAVVHLIAGPRGEEVTRLLRVAERDPTVLPDAAGAINAMPPLDKRHVWTTYARLSAPERFAR